MSVVFPSGWLMMAKLRRLAISSGGAAAAGFGLCANRSAAAQAATAVARRSRDCIVGSMRSRLACSQDVSCQLKNQLNAANLTRSACP